jgi:hypothetical protein
LALLRRNIIMILGEIFTPKNYPQEEKLDGGSTL